MADFSTLIATLQATIKTNYRQEITGQILQDDLLAMVNVINQLKQDTLAGYAFHGAPLADGASVSVTQNTFFLVGKGTYTINGTTETTGEGIYVLVYDSVDDEVRNYALFVYDTEPTENSRNAITSGAVAAALAPLATKEDVEAVEQEVAQIAGEAGLAEAVIDTDGAGTEQEFTFRKSGGDGGAYYRKIKGKTLAWNQLVADTGGSASALGVTFTRNADGSLTISGTATGGLALNNMGVVSILTGHKYLISLGKAIPGVSFGAYYESATHLGTGVGNASAICIVDGSQYSETAIGVFVSDGTSVNETVYPQIVDLTLEYGAGNEPATPTDFLAIYPSPRPHNPGTLISNDAEAVETTGVNQWDEEWENGSYDTGTGAKQSQSERIRAKDFNPCFPNMPYYFCWPNKAFNDAVLLFYDSNKNYIGYLAGIVNGTFTTPANAAYFTWYGVDTTYNHDICINLSNPAINGQYFPYWKRTLQLGITTCKDTDGNVPFADGMKGAGTASDWADKVGGEKRMKRINLGDLEWSAGGLPNSFVADFSVYNAKATGSNNIAINMICTRYQSVAWSALADKTASIDGHSAATLAIIDSAYPDAAAFKAAMQGVMLDYELATPVPFTWAEPLNLGVKVDENGTERAVAPEGATAPSAPFVADTTYTMSVARMVEKLQNL